MKINFNHESLSLRTVEYGKTQRIEIQVGRKNFKMDIDKNAQAAFISVYRIRGKARSKYDPGAGLKTILVKKDALITRDIIENIAEIEKAQDTMRKYGQVLA